jgi:hypothetical protein
VQHRNLITSDGALRLVIKIVEIPTLTCAVQRTITRWNVSGLMELLNL